MMLVDTALREREREGRPIRVGLLGAGFMARGVLGRNGLLWRRVE